MGRRRTVGVFLREVELRIKNQELKMNLLLRLRNKKPECLCSGFLSISLLQMLLSNLCED